ncbi:hypothetical protein ACJIZ3_023224 [Penstemon smallii]|uniref:Cyanobacterial aminoacyl-tRNA synthetase CAAD domain-containing protein n=1 Tax=Penstemon smallii TaxID=265156 RepID=A0ABD3TQX0_9LAMI
MELCTARGISNLPLLHPKHIQLQSFLHSRTQFPFLLKQNRFNSGLRYYSKSSLRSTASEETSTEINPYVANESKIDDVVPSEDNTVVVEKEENYDNQLNEVPQEGSFVDNLQLLKFLEDLDLKLDYEDTYSVLVFGGGGAVALWLAAAVIGAIDSVPVLPKVLELVGLGYSIWFSSRYLIFKKNRDELVSKVEQIKQQVFGSKDT